MSADNPKVRLTVHRDVLVIETVSPSDPDYPGWTPAGPGKIGCVIANTKSGLGVSAEALAWLRGVEKSRDSIGDVDWFACTDGTKAFAWLGGMYSVKRRGSEGSRSYEVFPEDCVIIPNEPPTDAMDVVNQMLDAQ